MLETLRPRLVEGTRARRRSDQSWGVQLGAKGCEAELAADQDSLFALIDGRRSLSEIAEAHLAAHRSMPFSALRDLLGTLAARGLLANTQTDRARAGFEGRVPWLRRAAHVRLASFSLPGGTAVTFALLAILLALGAIGSVWPAAQISSISVLLSYVGASLALSARSLTKAAALSAFGEPPRFFHVVSTFGVVHLALDTTSEVLLDQRPRAVALVAAFCGPALLVLAGQARPGIEFGASLVLLFDLCPFAPTSFGRLLATLAGKVDLREHARAYLTRRLLKRVISTHFFEGEWSLVTSSLLSLAWVCLGVRLLLTHGAAAAILLVRHALDAHGADRALALAGAAILVAAVPLALGALVATLARAVGAFVPNTARAGEHAGAVAAVDLDAVPLFMRLSSPEREAIAGAARVLRFPAGSRVVIEGELGDRFFAIRSGEVVVERELTSGLVKEIARLGPGDCFGETALLEKKPRTATVRALTETHALVLSQEDFARVRGQLSGDDVTALLRASAGLHRNALFSHLAADRLSALAMQLRPRTVEAGEEIVREGDPGDAFYLVESGKLEVTSGGKRVGTLGPGEHFGEVALLRDVPRTATVRALETSLLLALDKQKFIAAIASDLSLSAQLEEVAAARAGSAR